MNTKRTSAGTGQFPNMLKVARELGCQIRPSAGNPNILTGLCPFHESKKLHEAKTLQVDLQTARFWCIVCESAGNPMGFIAKVWGMSAQETYEFINTGCEVTAERPRRERNGRRNEDGPPEAQNTAVLTLASRYYGLQVETSFTALHHLARLGIEPRRAMELGFGYCPGEGLQEHLEQRGATPDEIEESPLFQEVTGMEILSGCLVLSDLDFTGATIWMIGMPQDEGDAPAAGWGPRRPRTRGIRGRRNQLFNLKDVSRQAGNIVLTDDPRLYLVTSAGGAPAAMTTRQRRNDNTETITERVGNLLARREVDGIVLAMHDRELGERIHQTATQLRPEMKTERRSLEEMNRQLNPQERDLDKFAGREPSKRGRTVLEEEKATGRPSTKAAVGKRNDALGKKDADGERAAPGAGVSDRPGPTEGLETKAGLEPAPVAPAPVATRPPPTETVPESEATPQGPSQPEGSETVET